MKDVMGVIRARRSVRCYRPEPLSSEAVEVLRGALEQVGAGPFGTAPRLDLLRPTDEEPGVLQGLNGLVGTYGTVKDAQAFLIGATRSVDHALEDFGYLMEGLVLEATALGVASCWLGGAFNRGRFSRAVDLSAGESVPAVVSLGYDRGSRRFLIDALIEGHHCYRQRRRPWRELFFDRELFGAPLDRATSGDYADALEALWLAPSSCNTQPWRVVRETGRRWHLLFQRNHRYSKKDRLIGNADLQRIDLGIAMCHFELGAREAGLAGEWMLLPKHPSEGSPEGADYVVTWSEL